MNIEDLIGLSLSEMQSMLISAEEPAHISMWPETEGWYWLGSGLLLLLIVAIAKWNAYRKKNAYRRDALSALSNVGENGAEIASIVRRVALVAYPRNEVAALHGEEWLIFLDKSGGKECFKSDIGRKMLQAPYLNSDKPVTGLNNLAKDWVRNHRLEIKP